MGRRKRRMCLKSNDLTNRGPLSPRREPGVSPCSTARDELDSKLNPNRARHNKLHWRAGCGLALIINGIQTYLSFHTKLWTDQRGYGMEGHVWCMMEVGEKPPPSRASPNQDVRRLMQFVF